MYNYQIILDNSQRDMIYISGDFDKQKAIDLFTSYFIFRKFKLIQRPLVDFISANGFKATDLSTDGDIVTDIIKQKNYKVIDLSNMDSHITNAFKQTKV